MKSFFLVLLLCLVSCQEASKKETRAIEKVSPTEEDSGLLPEDFVMATNVEGLQVSGEKLSKQQDVSTAENFKVIETATHKTLDDFSLFEWGPVSFKTEGNILKVFPRSDVLEINYQLDDKKKVVRTAKCEFKARPDSAKYKAAFEAVKPPNPDWEGFFDSLSQLAYDGNKQAYDFFMNPDAEAKSYLKHADGAASIEPIVNVLKFMKANGCNW